MTSNVTKLHGYCAAVVLAAGAIITTGPATAQPDKLWPTKTVG